MRGVRQGTAAPAGVGQNGPMRNGDRPGPAQQRNTIVIAFIALVVVGFLAAAIVSAPPCEAEERRSDLVRRNYDYLLR